MNFNTTVYGLGQGARTAGLPRSFSGSDYNIWAYFTDSTSQNIIKLGNLQTITSSSATSIAPVEAIGKTDPLDFTMGSTTRAGSLVFTLFNVDPLYSIMGDAGAKNKKLQDRDDFISPYKLPPFNIVIEGDNEYVNVPTRKAHDQDPTSIKTKIVKVIVGVKLFMHGETLSIDDFFTEQVYQYQCKYVTPWQSQELDLAKLYNDAVRTSPHAERIRKRDEELKKQAEEGVEYLSNLVRYARSSIGKMQSQVVNEYKKASKLILSDAP